MVLYNYKYDSVLNTTLARIINGVLLFGLLVLWVSTAFHWNIKTIEGSTLAIMFAYILASTYIGVSIVLNRNKWCVIDQSEDKRKESFIIIYCCLSFFLATLIAIASAFVISWIKDGTNGVLLYINIAIIVYLIFNKINICSLFKLEEMMPLYDCSDLDMIKHILARDYHIDLDEVLWDSKRFRGLEK